MCVHTQLCLCDDVTAKLHLIHLLLLLLVEAAAACSFLPLIFFIAAPIFSPSFSFSLFSIYVLFLP